MVSLGAFRTAPTPNPKDCLLLAVHICRIYVPSTTWRLSIPWLQETLLLWSKRSVPVSTQFLHSVYSVYDDKLQSRCHLPASDKNCVTHRQELKDFLDTTQESLYKKTKQNKLAYITRCAKMCIYTQTLYITFKLVGINLEKFFLSNFQNFSHVFL
jgi:hypothetical protein